MTDFTPTTAADVTEQILELALETADSWCPDRIDWEIVLDRMDGADLDGGLTLDWGNSLTTPAIRKIKKYVLDMRKKG